jgi:hypothetical protein
MKDLAGKEFYRYICASQNPSNLHSSPVLASVAERELGIGAVFRCRSARHHYRFSMNSAASCRRLVRRIAGTFTAQAAESEPGRSPPRRRRNCRTIGWPRRLPRRSESGLSLRDIASS